MDSASNNAVNGLIERLQRHAIISLDTSIFIYHFEDNPRYRPLTNSILTLIEQGHVNGVASVLALMELTVHPWRLQLDGLARQYETLLINFPHLTVADIDRPTARRAAQLRAGYALAPADALHAATALTHRATALVGNDRHFLRLSPQIEVLLLDDFIAQLPK